VFIAGRMMTATAWETSTCCYKKLTCDPCVRRNKRTPDRRITLKKPEFRFIRKTSCFTYKTNHSTKRLKRFLAYRWFCTPLVSSAGHRSRFLPAPFVFHFDPVRLDCSSGTGSAQKCRYGCKRIQIKCSHGFVDIKKIENDIHLFIVDGLSVQVSERVL